MIPLCAYIDFFSFFLLWRYTVPASKQYLLVSAEHGTCHGCHDTLTFKATDVRAKTKANGKRFYFLEEKVPFREV